MDIKYPIEIEYMKCVLQINGFSGPRPRSSPTAELGRLGGVTICICQDCHVHIAIKVIIIPFTKFICIFIYIFHLTNL